jgi:signal transduction histidine kinase/CheY-like chemotaxis protein
MTAQTSSWSAELTNIFGDLQQQTIRLIVPGLVLTGLVIMIAFPDPADTLWSVVVGAGCLALAALAWLLVQWRFAVAAVVVVAGTLALIILMLLWGGFAPAIVALAVPVGLTMLLLGLAPAAVMATSLSLALSVPVPGLPAEVASLRGVTLLTMWAAVAMIWLTIRPLLTTVEWAWSGYQNNLALLEQTRETQLRLEQTLEDYATANKQLITLNQQVQGLRQVAEDARRIKEEFVANVSHELRTPLNMIIGFSEMVLNVPHSYGGRVPQALLADLKIIHRNSQHLASLVDDVLDLSQVEAGWAALTKERGPFEEVVEAAMTAVQPLFESKGLYLRAELMEDLPPVLCDRTRIREVLLNLLSNAGRFTEVGGVIVRVTQQAGMLKVTVEDTGPGIPKESLGRIFEPFEQLDNSIRRKYGGSGLGLAISKEFVELHGGTMQLESTVGSGTTISFTLPIAPPVPIAAGADRWIQPDWEYRQRTRPSRVTPAPLRPRFVVLEKGGILRRLLRRYWDEVHIIETRTLDQALAVLSEETVHAFLINDGSISDTLGRLRDSSATVHGTPIFVCTIPDIAEAATDLGASDYLIKPVSREALLSALTHLAPEGRRILVVDDEPDALRLFWRILASADRKYQVMTASNGQQALELMRTSPPDAILLDLVMPDMDGFKLLEAKQKDPSLRDIPAVVLSARDPTGQAIMSESLLITYGEGLSVAQLLASIESVYRVIAPMAPLPRRAPDPTSPEAAPG